MSNIDKAGKGSSSGLVIIPLKRGGDELQSEMPRALNLFLLFLAFCILYGYYLLFVWVWLVALEGLGEGLLWAFFGAFCAVGIGMASGVAYSMKHQQIGWWTVESIKPSEAKGQCCGIVIY